MTGNALERLTIIGGGLAGAEAAWQVARQGIKVLLYEMRPARQTPAHVSEHLAELVCSNSLGSDREDRAPGLLKAEIRRLGSLILACADDTAVPAGSALAVGREAFATLVTRCIEEHPLIHLRRQEVPAIPKTGAVVVATGPLTSEALSADVARIAGEEHLFFYDAMAPIVTYESIDMTKAFRASRYDRGEADYVNCPMTREQYYAFVEALVNAETIPLCAEAGAASPQDPCLLCDAGLDPVAWTPAEDGEACDDGDLCTLEGTCQGGACVTEPDPCDDDNPCTDGACHPTDGCAYAPLTGTECPPPDACTEWAICQDGVCVSGDGIDCDDGNICTGDSCLADGGCAHTTLDGVPCDDGSVCTLDDVCVGDVCGGGATTSCDDGNECTADLCHPVSGCYHELGDNPCCDDQGVNICDDGDHCTTDSCDPDTGECFYDFNALPCDDQDSCTGPDLCTEGACVGAPMDCEDGNPCTVDACEVGVGCVHAPADAGLACDDGLACSTGDHCEEGLCVADLSECGCVVDFSDAVNKVNGLEIGTDGQVGSGLDVDNDPTTCSPAGSCGSGIDNALSMLGGFANEALQGAVEDGDVIFLFEHREFSATGEVYEVVFHIGEAADDQCDVQAATCPYLADPATFDESCAPLVSLDNATINGATLSGGGPGYSFPLVLPISDGVLLEVTLFATQVQAQVSFEAGMPVSLDGILAGAISKAAMIEALDAVPADQLPLDKDLIIQMIQGLIQSDIDSDGDGAMDAASVGLPFTAISGTIVGLAQE